MLLLPEVVHRYEIGPSCIVTNRAIMDEDGRRPTYSEYSFEGLVVDAGIACALLQTAPAFAGAVDVLEPMLADADDAEVVEETSTLLRSCRWCVGGERADAPFVPLTRDFMYGLRPPEDDDSIAPAQVLSVYTGPIRARVLRVERASPSSSFKEGRVDLLDASSGRTLSASVDFVRARSGQSVVSKGQTIPRMYMDEAVAFVTAVDVENEQTHLLYLDDGAQGVVANDSYEDVVARVLFRPTEGMAALWLGGCSPPNPQRR